MKKSEHASGDPPVLITEEDRIRAEIAELERHIMNQLGLPRKRVAKIVQESLSCGDEEKANKQSPIRFP